MINLITTEVLKEKIEESKGLPKLKKLLSSTSYNIKIKEENDKISIKRIFIPSDDNFLAQERDILIVEKNESFIKISIFKYFREGYKHYTLKRETYSSRSLIELLLELEDWTDLNQSI